MPTDAQIVQAIIKDLRDAALKIKIKTIPLYLYATYSIKFQGFRAKKAIKGVVMQEMSHLALVGNLMSALGANPTPQLYHKDVVPRYPDGISYNFVEMNLEAASQDTLRAFIQAVAPLPSEDLARNIPKTPAASGSAANKYQTTGELYTKIINAIATLSDDPKLFGNTAKQCTDFQEENLLITDKTTAIKGMSLVMDQGGGGGAVPEAKSHAATFKRILEDFKDEPWGLYDVPKNPATKDYPEGSYIRKLSLAFDAAYCYLLQAIDNIWKTENTDDDAEPMDIIDTIMENVLTPLASILVLQPFRNGCAAPCFNYYPNGADPMAPTQLQKAILQEITEAIGLIPTDEVISIAVGRCAKTAGEAAIIDTRDDMSAMKGVWAIRAGATAIETPSLTNATGAVSSATIAGDLSMGAKAAATEAQLLLDQKAKLDNIQHIVKRLTPVN